MLGAEKRQAAARMRMPCASLAGLWLELCGVRGTSVCPGNHLLDGKEEAGPRLSGWLLGPGQQGLRQHQKTPADVGGQSSWPPWWAQLGWQSSSGSRGLR